MQQTTSSTLTVQELKKGEEIKQGLLEFHEFQNGCQINCISSQQQKAQKLKELADVWVPLQTLIHQSVARKDSMCLDLEFTSVSKWTAGN